MDSNSLITFGELNVNDEKVLKIYLTEIMSEGELDDINGYWHKIMDILIETNVSYDLVIDHPIFIHIKNTFVDILQEPQDDFFLFRRIGQLFSRIANYVDNKNIHLFQPFFIDATIIEVLSKELNRVSLTSHENLIHGIQYMVDAYQKFQRDRPRIQDDPILSTLITPIVNLVKAPEYQTSFLALSPKQNELTHFQHLILITCPKYIVTFWCQRQEETAYAVAEEILHRSSHILQCFLTDIDDWKESVIWCIFYLIWLCQYCSDDRLLLDYKIEHGKILDCVLELVQAKELLRMASADSTSDNLQKRASQLVCYATLYIYATTFLSEFCQKLKKSNTTSILLRLTKVNYDKTQFHAYRTLAVILSEHDIKQLADPAQITAVFITYLKQSMSVASRGRRLANLLFNLKNLIQHDQIKAEFVRQCEGLALLIDCARESEFDVAKVQLYALEIIMSLTFNDEANNYIKQNDNFIQYIQTLVSTTTNRPALKKVADGILWRLFPKGKKAKTEYLYDIMISYSHKEKDVCHRIYNSLIGDKFRVWIDREGLHGAMMEAMAHAIEQSHYVLICMSDNYHLSPYCQAEAQYAFEKRRQLIPLRVQSGYKAEGWLAFVTSGRLYIDFMKMDYDTAYAQLVSELHRVQVNRKSSLMITTNSNVIEAPSLVNVRAASSYPSNIRQWTPVDVRDFLLEKQLHSMVPICQLMDGETLIELYKMCRINSPVMLQTLRSETMEHSVQLSTYVYLTFLRELKKLIPEEKPNRTIFRFHNCTLI